ncbi:hypothetical protein ACIPQA_16560 [Streptomyces sp. NPDC090109]|uniref:hypothetical protein n=1 Tax=Streptomyces sp. NPDC090109 TaxID=3365948 RepID=UPI00380206EE
MSKQQQNWVLLVAAVAGQVLVSRYVKSQAAALGLSTAAVAVVSLAVGAALS